MDGQFRAELVKLEEQGFQSICFWLPAYNVGGGTYYFCQMAKYMAKNSNFKVYYMDFEDGYPSGFLKDSSVKVLCFQDEDTDFPVEEKCVIVTNSTRVIQLQRMNPENKLLFWHFETAPSAWHAVFIQDEYFDFLKLCKAHNAMVFHDWSGRNIFKHQYGIEFDNKSYLRMYLPEKTCVPHPEFLVEPGAINVLWIGRVSHDKVQSIFQIIRCFADYKTDKVKKFHIVGDGLKMSELKKFAKRYEKQISFNFAGTVFKEDLDQYIEGHADVVFAMGLSTLEGAAMKVPSVVVQLDTKPINGDEFFWLFDTKEYCVGIMPYQKDDFSVRFTSFSEIMDDICKNGMKGQRAAQCYDYYKDNGFDFNMIMSDFVGYVNQCTLTMADLEACIKYIPYNHVEVTEHKFLKWVISRKVKMLK